MGGRDHSETCETCGYQSGGLDDLLCACQYNGIKDATPDSVGSRDIIERLRKLPQYVITIQDREGYTYERGCEGQPMNYTGILLEDAERFVEEETGFPDFVDRMIEKRAAEAAVQAAADTRTREIVDAIEDLLQSNGHYDMAIEVARRFPVSDCDTTREER